MRNINREENFEKDRARFESRNAWHTRFNDSLDEALKAFHPLLPEDQAAFDQIVKEVIGPETLTPITHIGRARKRRRGPGKP